MNILMMIPGFFILSGIAVFLMRLLRVRFGEGMFLAVSVVVGLLFLSGKTGTLFYGQAILVVLGVVGLFWNLIAEIRGRDIGSAWNVPVFWILVLVLLYGMVNRIAWSTGRRSESQGSFMRHHSSSFSSRS